MQKKTGKALFDINWSNIILYQSLRVTETRPKINKWDNQNYKLFYSKGEITKWKDNLQNGRQYCEWSDWQRGLSPGYTNSSYSLI